MDYKRIEYNIIYLKINFMCKSFLSFYFYLIKKKKYISKEFVEISWY